MAETKKIEKKKRATEEKRLEQSKARNLRNTMAKSMAKTAVKKANIAIAENADSKTELVNAAAKTLDKIASKGVIHKNKAARKKSRLMKKLNSAE